MKIIMLGTGHALVRECYNTCFVISDASGNFLVDAGGGNLILHRLKHAGISVDDIHDVFVTHKHIDHVLGMIWLIRIIAQDMNRGVYSGNTRIFGNDDVLSVLLEMCEKLLLPYQFAFVGSRIIFRQVNDGEICEILGRDVRFFDIGSNRTKQFGFNMFARDGRKFLTCCGDETFHESYYDYAQGSDWLLHEAFCLSSKAEICKPYEKNHSTVKDACENAARLGAKNLLIYHASDENILTRREDYTREAREFFHGNIFVPYDLEVIDLGEEF